MSLFEIEFYEKADGTAPVKEFLEGLDTAWTELSNTVNHLKNIHLVNNIEAK